MKQAFPCIIYKIKVCFYFLLILQTFLRLGNNKYLLFCKDDFEMCVTFKVISGSDLGFLTLLDLMFNRYLN